MEGLVGANTNYLQVRGTQAEFPKLRHCLMRLVARFSVDVMRAPDEQVAKSVNVNPATC